MVFVVLSRLLRVNFTYTVLDFVEMTPRSLPGRCALDEDIDEDIAPAGRTNVSSCELDLDTRRDLQCRFWSDCAQPPRAL